MATELQQVLSVLRRIERNTLLLQVQGIDIMATAQEMQDKVDALVAGQAEAKADALRHETRTNEAIAMIQDLRQAIIDLQSQQSPITQAQLDAMVLKLDTGLADMTAANTQRDAADAALASGVAPPAP
jgi:hypothetical protein